MNEWCMGVSMVKFSMMKEKSCQIMTLSVQKRNSRGWFGSIKFFLNNIVARSEKKELKW
jgi:hypothetical protein